MSTPNPFIPAGSLIAEGQRRNRTQFKVGVYAVLAAHTMLLLGLLIQGCRSDQSANAASGDNLAALVPAPTNTAAVTRTPPEPLGIGAAPKMATPVPASVPIDIPPVFPPTPVLTGPVSSGESHYAVKAGDTLSRIARARGTTIKAIRTANHLTDERLAVGQKLIIPSPRPLASAASTAK